MLLSELGQRIRAQRERLRLKQQDIAHALQVSPQAVSKWERGENGPDLFILGDLARVLGVSTDWLLDTHSDGLDVFTASVLTSTVVGAYEKSLHLAARDFAAWANGCFFQLTGAVLRYDGVPISYMGDAFLCFFSGINHQQRAVRTAFLARQLISEHLVFGVSSGEIYLGAIGHPDYARPDIVGEVVNVAFLARDWAETHTQSGIAATASVTEGLDDRCDCEVVQTTDVHFKRMNTPVQICELRET
jgi:transcriptional regulator with XRE-family HTH domain